VRTIPRVAIDATVSVADTHSSGPGDTMERPSRIATWRRSYERTVDTPAVSPVAITMAESARADAGSAARSADVGDRVERPHHPVAKTRTAATATSAIAMPRAAAAGADGNGRLSRNARSSTRQRG